jgi:hypothetical protein
MRVENMRQVTRPGVMLRLYGISIGWLEPAGQPFAEIRSVSTLLPSLL